MKRCYRQENGAWLYIELKHRYIVGMSSTPTPVATACELAGGQAKLATLLGVTPSAVHQWVKGVREVPAERCPEIEAATGGQVTCEQLRPDVRWSVLRQQSSATAPAEQVG